MFRMSFWEFVIFAISVSVEFIFGNRVSNSFKDLPYIPAGELQKVEEVRRPYLELTEEEGKLDAVLRRHKFKCLACWRIYDHPIGY